MELIKVLRDEADEREDLLEILEKEFDALTQLNEETDAIEWVPPSEEEKRKFKIDPRSVKSSHDAAKRSNVGILERVKQGDVVRVFSEGKTEMYIITELESGIARLYAPKSRTKLRAPIKNFEESHKTVQSKLTRGDTLGLARAKPEDPEGAEQRANLYVYNVK